MKLIKTITERHEFRYQKGSASLSFGLDEDRRLISDFKKCLQEAIRDVNSLLGKLPK